MLLGRVADVGDGALWDEFLQEQGQQSLAGREFGEGALELLDLHRDSNMGLRCSFYLCC